MQLRRETLAVVILGGVVLGTIAAGLYLRTEPPAQGNEYISVVPHEDDSHSPEIVEVPVSDGTVVLDSRAATRVEAPFEFVKNGMASAGQVIVVPPKAGDAPGAVEMPFAIAVAGEYSIWVRVFWGTDGEKACSNSLWLVLDGETLGIIQDATYEVWHWVPLNRGAPVELRSGAHQFLFTNCEDGIKFDQVFITPWYEDEFDRCVPQGIEQGAD